jgi:hypothetical protein
MRKLLVGSTLGETFTLLKNIEEVRRFVDNYNREYRGQIRIGDLSGLTIEAQSVLLKFVEEQVDDLVCYASRDNINPVLMSRFDRVERYDDIKIGVDSFEGFVRGMEERDVYDVSLSREFVAKSAQNLPAYLTYRKMKKGMRSRVAHLL